jgi:hypothetical protein
MLTWQVQPVPVQGPVGALHGTPLQQSAVVVHSCPYCAHGGGPLLEDALVLLDVPPEVLLDVPPELVDVLLLLEPGLQGPQVPTAVVSGWMQVVPTQQSASTVHAPQLGTHAPPW